MKRLKKLIALVMVLTLVLSSITIDNHFTRAEESTEAKVILILPKVESGETYAVEVKKADEDTSVFSKEVTVGDEATATDATNNKTGSVIRIDDSSIKWESGVTYNIVVKQENNGLTTQTTGSFKAEAGKPEYKITLDEFESVWDEITLKLGAEYEELECEAGDKKVNKEDTATVTLKDTEGGITLEVGKKITVTGINKSDGLKYSGEIELNSDKNEYDITMTDTGEKYKLAGISMPEGVKISYSIKGSNSFSALDTNTILDKATEYTIKIEASTPYKELVVKKGNDVISGQHEAETNQNEWIDTYKWDIGSNDYSGAKISVTEETLTLKVAFDETDNNKYYPWVWGNVGYKYIFVFSDGSKLTAGENNNYTVPDYVDVKSKPDKVIFDTLKKEDGKSEIKFRVGSIDIDSDTTATIVVTPINNNFNCVSSEYSFTVEIGSIVPKEDYDIKTGTDSEYYNSSNKVIYYRTADNNPVIVLHDTNYNEYSYSEQYEGGKSEYSAFTEFKNNDELSLKGEKENFTVLLRMRKRKNSGDDDYSKYAVGTQEIVIDNGAPLIKQGAEELSNSNDMKVEYDNENQTGTSLNLTATDEGSGVEGIYIKEKGQNDNDSIKIEDIKFDTECREKVYIIYAKDNVGNRTDDYELKVTVDSKEPELKLNDNTINAEQPVSYTNNTENSISFKLSVTDMTLSDAGKNTIGVSIKKSDESDDELFDAEWIKSTEKLDGETAITANSFNETIVIPKGTLKDGTYIVTINAKDTMEHEASATFTFVVDNTAPELVQDSCEMTEVNITDNTSRKTENNFEAFVEKNANFNKDSRLSYELTEANFETAILKVYDKDNNEKDIDLSNSGCIAADISFAEIGELFSAKNIILYVKDKAGNESEFNILKDILDKENANIIHNAIELTGVDVTNQGGNSENVIKTVSGKITGNITYSGATTVDTSLIRGYLVNDKGDVAKSLSFTQDEDGFTFMCDVPEQDGTYKIEAYYYDIAAENIKDIVSSTYIYDSTSPVVEADYNQQSGTLVYTLTETNPDFENFEISASGKNNEGKLSGEKVTLNGTKVQSFEALVAKLKSKSGWKKENDSYTATIKLNVEGEYKLSIKAKDLAKNVSVKQTSDLLYDVTAPQLQKYEVETKENTTNTDYSQFDASKAKVSLEIYELVSADVSVSCNVHDDKEKTDKTYVLESENNLLEQDKSVFSGEFDIKPDFKGTITFTTSDGNGNTTARSIKYDKGIVVESKKMHASTSSLKINDLNTQDARNDIYNENVNLSFNVKDTYSGIRSISYSLNGKTKEVALDQTGNIIKTWSGTDKIAATVANEGDKVPVVLTVTDNAGHVTETTKYYKIDVTKPEISVSYDNNSPQNEKYYNKVRTATITIKEHNFENAGVVLTVKRNGASVSVSPNFHYVSNDTYAMNYAFAEDGDYEFTLSCTDLAGNHSEYSQTDTFTIDQTKPTMTISYDNNNAYSGNYYGQARTATITVTEHNFDANSIKINVSAVKDGTTVASPSISGFSTRGDVHTATIVFNQDADYTISATSSDLAGNNGEEIQQQTFTIDLTNPEITIEGITSNTSYTGSVLPVVQVTDGNYDTEGITITVVGGKNGVQASGYTSSVITHGQSFAFNDLPHTQEMDDCYVLTVNAVDKAGHETTETMAYRVNRFGSVYTVSKELEAALEAYYATSSDKYAIFEQNVDELETYSVSYTIDNDIVNLEEGKDFTIINEEIDTGWNQYEYTLSEDSFSKEGVYTITVSSEDKVGNVSDNKSKGLSMEFCIDNTAPVCVISGVDDGQKYDRDVDANIVIEAYDNIKFASMKVELNGEEIRTEDDLQDGKLSLVVNPTSGEQVLKVTCYDAAGNEKIEEVHFSFDVSILQSHTWIIFVIIGICLVLIFFIIIMLRRKNAKQ